METKNDIIIALAGNPNVGKSTVFNQITGQNQHTGNWTGKTVSNAFGTYMHKDIKYTLVDLPGTYSLMANSKEEAEARNFIYLENPNAVIVVLDATCLERNLNLAIQILEITKDVVLCVNLLDEAKKKKIEIDLDELSLQLGVPVVGTSARSGGGLKELKEAVEEVVFKKKKTFGITIKYGSKIEASIEKISSSLISTVQNDKLRRFYAIKFLDNEQTTTEMIFEAAKIDNPTKEKILVTAKKAREELKMQGISKDNLRDIVVTTIVKRCEDIFSKSVKFLNPTYNNRDRKIDKVLTSKLTGIPIMILLLGIIFWITIFGANVPSDLLARFFNFLGTKLYSGLQIIGLHDLFIEIIVNGIYKTTTWVVAVMLPPMAIFFPLFTLLEDFGYLPRIAFNLDKFFKKANAHGKQSLTMCMGFGCNACGVIGSRIIDSPRERLIAIITNAFVPCNGRFPTLITLITIFLTGSLTVSVYTQSFITASILLLTILLGIFLTLGVSKFLSFTILRGVPSSFALELPPYRRPQIGKVIVRSLFDRTLFVLGRALIVAAPAGFVIWMLANCKIGDYSVLKYCTNFLDPFASFFGMDGVILFAFILGFPANEIVIPIIIMAYLSSGVLTETSSLLELYNLLAANNWSIVTAVCTMLFCLFHFPCSTTCLTIFKETKSYKWTAISWLAPTLCGFVICFFTASIMRLIGF
ncbi:ferrous iron transport protein B [Clostridia bacterium]|nr:ferrous iron transport protein B [Clostridia bacterium]